MSFKKVISLLALLIIFIFPLHSVSALDLSTSPDLELGVTNPFVASLQQLLNSNGYIVNPTSGQPGSLGYESNYFGSMTKSALSKFQSAFGISPSAGYFGQKTKAQIAELIASGKLSQPLVSAPKGPFASSNFNTTLIGCVNGTATSLQYYSITWTFSSEVSCGNFANGEPWVVGPVTITAISPNSENGVQNSGSMKMRLPNSLQGYQTKMGYISGWDNSWIYDSSLDASLNLPYQLNSGDMLMTSRGQLEQGDVRSTTNEIAVLTALSTVPAEESFRPALWGTEPRVVTHNKNDIDWSVLKNFPTVPSTPSRSSIENFMPGLPWFEFDNRWVQSGYGPANNFATNGAGVSYPNSSSVYGREIAGKWSLVALWLNTNNTQAVKEKTMIQTIQSGIDIASYLKHGGMFYSDGGHKVGRKFPTLLAGLALNDAEILAIAGSKNPLYFSEDQTTFVVCGAENNLYCPPGHVNDVGRVVNGGVDAQYTQADVGLAEWGIRHANEPQNDNRNWSSNYRHVQWPAMSGQILAAEIMGQKTAWNHVETFLYNDRYFEVAGGVGDDFFGQMWDAYKPVDGDKVLPVIINPNGGTFSFTKLVTMTSATPGAEIRYTTDGSIPNSFSTLYTDPILVSNNVTFRAIALKPGVRSSAVITAAFTLSASADWTLHYVDSEETPNYPAIYAFDGNPATYWHTGWNNNPVTPLPHEIQINLGKTQTINGFSYLHRNPGAQDNGQIAQYEFYVSADGANWGSPVASGVLGSELPAKIVNFSPVSARYIRLKALSATNGSSPIVIAEIRLSVVGSDAPETTIPPATNPPITSTPNDTDSDGISDTLDKCSSTPTSLKTLVNAYGCPKPITTLLKTITDMHNTDITNIPNLIIEDKDSIKGRISFTQPINIFGTTNRQSQINLDTYIQFGDRKVTVDSASQFNKPATITLYNIVLTKPLIKRNGLTTKSTYTYDKVAKTLTFNVDGFSVYEVVEDNEISNGSSGGTSNGSSGGSSKNKFALSCTIENTTVGIGSIMNIDTTVKNAASAYTLKFTGSMIKLPGFDINKEDQTITFNKKGSYTLKVQATDQKKKKATASCKTVKVSDKYTQVKSQTPSITSTNTPREASSIPPGLRLGQELEGVRTLQKYLNQNGYIINTKSGAPGSVGNESTYFGNLTTDAIKKFQKAKGLPVTGLFDEATRARIN